VNLAGKPSKVGGVVTGVLGWLVLLFGLSIALLFGLLLHAIWTLGVALAVALPLAFMTLGIGVPLVVGGKALRRSGTDTERDMRDQALLSMLAEQGRVSAAAAAGALGLRMEEADAALTGLAKRQPDRVGVDVDEEGTVWYRAAAAFLPASAFAAPARVRVDEPEAPVEAGAEEATAEPDSRAGGKVAR
jgi:hypothetical protein